MSSNFVGEIIKDEVKPSFRFESKIVSGEDWVLKSDCSICHEKYSSNEIIVRFVKTFVVGGIEKIKRDVEIFSINYEDGDITVSVGKMTRGTRRGLHSAYSDTKTMQSYIESLTDQELNYLIRKKHGTYRKTSAGGVGMLLSIPMLPTEVKNWLLISGLGGPNLNEIAKELTKDFVKMMNSRAEK